MKIEYTIEEQVANLILGTSVHIIIEAFTYRDFDEQVAKFCGRGGLEALADTTTFALKYLQRAISLSKKAIRWARHDIAWTNLCTDPYFQSMVSET